MCSHYHLNSAELARLVITGISCLLANEDDIDDATAELAELVAAYLKIHQRITQYQTTMEER